MTAIVGARQVGLTVLEQNELLSDLPRLGTLNEKYQQFIRFQPVAV